MQTRHSLLLCALVAGVAACNKPAGQTSSNDKAAEDKIVVKIGTANPLTGPFAHWGRDADDGVKLAVQEANAEKLVLDGKPASFEVVSEDDQADPKVATQVAQRMVDAKVAGIVGHLTSGAAIPASRIYSDAGIPMISGSVTSPSFTQQGYRNTFRLIANDQQQGEALAKYAVGKLGAKRVAVIDDRTTYGQGLADDFAKAVEQAGGKVVKREFTTNSATDFMAVLTSIKGEKPDLLFYGGMDAQAGPMVKQMGKLGIKAAFMGADGVNTPEFAKLGGGSAEGAYASSAGLPKEKLPGYADFNQKFKQQFQTEIQAYAPYNYDAAKVLIAAMKRAGSADPAKYLPEVAKTDYQGVTGPVKFDAKGDIQQATVSLYQLKQGKWVGL
ncbi:branched-chain amino acid ABC transporter substrate-binding protein [Chromobacterium subtsugae]|uniref:Branched-chain amino acid ABC transporter substrate-binding protein n=1 Tax=Chromobacterium subtsugae TaxID=251747 RepID=A0ABS7FJ46_9NEIS|nr:MULTISPECIES: branched-chain amino acid ABC transporter substrate-binding protein [Chromobacterium]KUM04272.1 branched-chain amino acid ABC transporter substrate-binding protein [Chromobacterium subtsugae]KZE85350.1 branched chain amino acid ABC transporter substrate-binding protein [Chromobacterium sp. F49]MBW7568871.1 branched-chain amino acid ABC transporter substrate-binding protein [Chromobacterium subtsugae]MBW8290069.1 branched-chain amino acid ABC transporter substrate-binding protei